MSDRTEQLRTGLVELHRRQLAHQEWVLAGREQAVMSTLQWHGRR